MTVPAYSSSLFKEPVRKNTSRIFQNVILKGPNRVAAVCGHNETLNEDLAAVWIKRGNQPT